MQSKTTIPTGWKQVKFEEILKIGNGKDYKHLNAGNIPVFGTGGFMKSVDKSLYSGKTVFIGRKGTIDKPFFYNGPFWTVDTLFYTHSFKNTSPEFVYLLFQKIDWKIHNEASGVPSLSKANIEKIKILLPPLPEQEKIVEVLETWDECLEKLRKSIKLKKNVKNGLMQKLLTGNERLPECSEKWKTIKLREIGIFSKGSGVSKAELSNSGYRAIRYGEIYTKHHFQIKKIYSFIEDKAAKLSKEIKNGDILFVGSGETIEEIGKSAVYLSNEKCFAGGDVIIFTPKNTDSLFLSFLLNVGAFRKALTKLGQGQSVVHIYKKDLEDLSITLPPLPEQTAIARILTAADQEIEALEKKKELVENQKKFLLNNLITGKLRLPEFTK